MRIPRRNSDSNLYCKKLLSEVTGPRQSPVLATRPPINQSGSMDPERLAFVQRYLEKSEDTRSMTTDTSDSGVPGTHETLSELGMEEVSGELTPYQPLQSGRTLGFLELVQTPVFSGGKIQVLWCFYCMHDITTF